MKTIKKTNLIKTLGALLLIAFTFTALSCNQPSSPSSSSNDSNNTNNSNESQIPLPVIAEAERIISKVKLHNWITDTSMCPNNSIPLKLKVQDNKIIITEANTGNLYYQFDITIPDSIHENSTTQGILFKTNDTHTYIGISLDSNETGLIVNSPYGDNLLSAIAQNNSFKIDTGSSSGSGASNQEIINSIKGNWNYSGEVANQQRTVNVTITDNKITLSWAGTPREASYSVNNGKITINYTHTEGGISTDYSGEFNVTLESNSFKLTGFGADASQIYAMFFGMTTDASSYEINFTK